MSDHDHCLQSLRIADRDLYLASLLIPNDYRSDITALYAFNAEIARVRDVVSEALPGEIRLQWWRDAISTSSEEARANPLANILLDVIEKYDLPRESFDKMLLARAFDLYDDPMPNQNDLEGYAGETTSLLFQLASLIAGADQSSKLADACGHAGVAYVLMQIVRDLPRHASRGQLYLPAELLKKSGAERERILNGEMHEGLANALSEMSALCREHRKKAQQAIHELPDNVQPVFLPLALIELYLKKQEKQGFNPFKDRAHLSQLRAQWVLWRAT